MHELKGVLQVDSRPIDVLGISETFLTSNNHDSRIKIDGYYQPDRRDRSGKRGGGHHDFECDDLELLWTELMPHRSTSFLVCFIYRPRKTVVRTDREVVSNIENSLCPGRCEHGFDERHKLRVV